MGVTECDNMLMLLGVSNKMSEKVSVIAGDAFTANICKEPTVLMVKQTKYHSYKDFLESKLTQQ